MLIRVSYLKESSSIRVTKVFFIWCSLPYHTDNWIVIALSGYISLHDHILSFWLSHFKTEECWLLEKVQALHVVSLSLFLQDTDRYVGVVVFPSILMLLQLLNIELMQPVTYDVLSTISKPLKIRSVTLQVLDARLSAVFEPRAEKACCLRKGLLAGC